MPGGGTNNNNNNERHLSATYLPSHKLQSQTRGGAKDIRIHGGKVDERPASKQQFQHERKLKTL